MDITRVDGPKRSGYSTRSLKEIVRIVIHHGATRQGLAGTNYLSYLDWHVTNPNGHEWSLGGYTYGIEDDGEIKQGYELTEMTHHVGAYNRTSLGIVLPGDFRFEDPTKEQWDSLYNLLDYLKGVLPNDCEIVGHQEVPGYSWKPCPSLDMGSIRKNAASSKLDIEAIIKNEEATNMVLREGDKGPDTKTLQEQLNDLGHNVGSEDGHFGPKTESGVKSFQRAANISVDGIAGPKTFAELEKAIKGKQTAAKSKKETATVTLGGNKITLTLE